MTIKKRTARPRRTADILRLTRGLAVVCRCEPDIGGRSGGLCRKVDPALVVVAGDPDGDKARGCVVGYITGPGHEQVVDFAGNDEGTAPGAISSVAVTLGRVEQPEGDVQGFPKQPLSSS